MKIAVSIPDNLFRNAEQAKKRLGLSRSEFYRRALDQYIQRLDDHAVTAALDKACEEHPEIGRLDPVLSRLQWAALARDSDSW